jgi:lipid-binding SYLF domain-containing protein
MRQRNKGTFLVLGTVFLAVLLVWAPGRAAGKETFSDAEERVEKSIEVLQEIIEIPEEGLPQSMLKKAAGIAIIPGVIKAAYGLGGQYGKGILVIRNENGSWTNPVFLTLIGGSYGWQIGVQKADIVLVFLKRKSIDDIASGKLTLGADAGVVAGPVGRSAEASTDLDLEAEIYSYSKSKGLFAGISIKGASIQIDKDSLRTFYDRSDLDAEDVFSHDNLKSPSIVKKLKKALAKYTLKRI